MVVLPIMKLPVLALFTTLALSSLIMITGCASPASTRYMRIGVWSVSSPATATVRESSDGVLFIFPEPLRNIHVAGSIDDDFNAYRSQLPKDAKVTVIGRQTKGAIQSIQFRVEMNDRHGRPGTAFTDLFRAEDELLEVDSTNDGSALSAAQIELLASIGRAAPGG